MCSDFIHGNVACTGRIIFFKVQGAAMFILVGKDNTG